MRLGLLPWMPLATLVGCGTGETGFLLEVKGPSGISSTEAGIESLELLMARPSWCERWVLDSKASHTRAAVAGRDLAKSPYSFLVKPARETDLEQPVHVVVLGKNGQGRVIAQAGFGQLKWEKGEIRKYTEKNELIARGGRIDGPEYIAADGCICMPGHPWIGTGSGTGCDQEVLPSLARLADTRDCELPRRLTTLPTPVCDGQTYPGEAVDRQLPCFAVKEGACHIATRGCYDDSGMAYENECFASLDGPVVPQTLCDAYLACERTACGDVVGCFRGKIGPAKPLSCTLRLAVTSDGKATPCPDAKWIAPRDFGCGAALLDGQSQPPFKFGLVSQTQLEPGPVVGECPFAMTASLDTDVLEQIPYTHSLYLTLGEKLILAEITTAIGCATGPAFACQ